MTRAQRHAQRRERLASTAFVTCSPWQRDEVAALLDSADGRWGLLNRRRLFVTDPDAARRAIGDRADWWESQTDEMGRGRFQQSDSLRALTEAIWQATNERESA